MGRQQWERNRSSLPCMNIYDIIITGIKPSQFLRAQAQPYIYISATPTIILTCSLLTSISDLISSHLQHNVCSYFLGFFTERNGHGCAPTRGEAFRPSDLSSTNLRRPILSHLSVRTFISLSLVFIFFCLVDEK